MAKGGPKKFKAGAQKVSLWLPVEYIKAIDEIAASERRNKAEIVREGLRLLFAVKGRHNLANSA